MSALTELDARIRAAAERTVREDGARAVLLFGSRARGEARPDSDVDLAVVSDDEPQKAADALISYLDIHRPTDVLTVDLSTLRHAPHAGTVWGNIVREGKVIAGDTNTLQGVDIMPIEGKTIGESLSGYCLTESLNCAAQLMLMHKAHEKARRADRQSSTDGPSSAARSYAQTAGNHSVNAAEHTVRALAQLTGSEETWSHSMKDAADKMRSRAKKLAREAGKEHRKTGKKSPKLDRAEQIEALAHTVSELNGMSAADRLLPYRGLTPPPERTLARLTRTMALQADMTQGLISGEGPLWWIQNAAVDCFKESRHADNDLDQLRKNAKAAAGRMAEESASPIEGADASREEPLVALLMEACRRWTNRGTQLENAPLESRAENALPNEPRMAREPSGRSRSAAARRTPRRVECRGRTRAFTPERGRALYADS